MTTREMMNRLLAECLEDAKRTVLDTLGGDATPEAVATVAAALFVVRWGAGTTRIFERIRQTDEGEVTLPPEVARRLERW